MRATWRILLGTSVVAGSLAMAAPAKAWVPDCELGAPPPMTFIEFGPTSVDIYPERVPGDAGSTAGWITDYVLCLEGGTAQWALGCVGRLTPTPPTVTIDPETGHVHIEHGGIPDLNLPLC